MKKFYTLLLATLVAVTAGAATTPRATESGWHSVGKGEWFEGLLTIFDQLDELSEDELHWEVEIEESDNDPGYYRFIPYHENSPVARILGAPDTEYMYIDATNPEKVFVQGTFCAYREYDQTAQLFMHRTPESGVYGSADEYYAYMENNVVYFPMASFVWLAPELEEFIPCDLEGNCKIVFPGGEIRPNWVPVGTGKYTDGFMCPFFKYFDKDYESTYTVDVQIEEKDHNPGYFRVQGAFAPFGSDVPMVIDARRADFVRLEQFDTGVTHDVRGSIEVYSNFMDMISPVKDCKTYEDYMEMYPHMVATFTENDDNTGVINFPADAIVLYFPEYYAQMGNPLQRWTNDDMALPTTITIPGRQNGVEDVAVAPDFSDAAPVYYNLQGARIDNPGPGLYIVRRGNTATKEIIR